MLQAQFVKSAVKYEEFPPEGRPEVALVGRSNAGKSSLLNAMTGQKGLAKVSSTPGKTRLINFFNVGKHYSIVDLPGYGFARGDKTEVKNWKQMVEGYLTGRLSLVGLLLICDVRRHWQPEEEMILQWAQSQDVPVLCVLAKADKVSQNEYIQLLKTWMKGSGLPQEAFRATSALKGSGVVDLEAFFFDQWIKPALLAQNE